MCMCRLHECKMLFGLPTNRHICFAYDTCSGSSLTTLEHTSKHLWAEQSYLWV